MTAHDLTDDQISKILVDLSLQLQERKVRKDLLLEEMQEINSLYSYYVEEMRSRIAKRSKQHGNTDASAIDESSID